MTQMLHDNRRGSGLTLTTDLEPKSAVGSTGFSLYSLVGKRLVDLAGASTALVILSPVLVAGWLLLRMRLGPQVLLVQRRIGRHGHPYDCYKFRTMRHDRRRARLPHRGVDRRKQHKSGDDPRHTAVGRVLRRHSLDEIPQLWNVLRGDMSLVGPRPELADRADSAFLGHVRHRVKPGLTGPFQLSELRRTGDLSTGLDLDERYVRTLSLRSDLRMLRRTAGAVLRGTGG